MLNFEKLKKLIVIREGKKYFNKEDIKYWNTNIHEVEGIKNGNLIIIKDNLESKEYNIKTYKIKVYNIDSKKINTIFATDSTILAGNILKFFISAEIKAENIETIMTGELIMEDKSKFIIKSDYIKKEFELFSLKDFLEV